MLFVTLYALLLDMFEVSEGFLFLFLFCLQQMGGEVLQPNYSNGIDQAILLSHIRLLV